MSQDNLVEFKTPASSASFNDALSELLRNGARQIIAQAVEAELSTFMVIQRRKRLFWEDEEKRERGRRERNRERERD